MAKSKKGFNNVLFDILGWAIMGIAIYKVFMLPVITVPILIPYATIFIFGGACVVFTIRGVVNMGRNKMKKK